MNADASLELVRKIEVLLPGHKLDDIILALSTVLATTVVHVPGTTDADIEEFLFHVNSALRSTIRDLRKKRGVA